MKIITHFVRAVFPLYEAKWILYFEDLIFFWIRIEARTLTFDFKYLEYELVITCKRLGIFQLNKRQKMDKHGRRHQKSRY